MMDSCKQAGPQASVRRQTAGVWALDLALDLTQKQVMVQKHADWFRGGAIRHLPAGGVGTHDDISVLRLCFY